ncbi:acyltransferase-domain-containing protein [Chytridium lagenaria]|nr:acyltransferase-domain-containing protein [Chytridium lagenaria]
MIIQIPSFVLLLHSHKLYRYYIRLTEQIFGSMLVITTSLLCPATKLVITGDFDLIKPKHRSILFANHQIYPDWFYLWIFAWLRGCHGDLKILLMEWLAYLPVFGAGMWFFEFIFMKRKWADDKENMKKHLLKANDPTEPLMLLIFPEGTLNTPHNKEASEKFAKKNDITNHPKHLLLPKSTGLFFCADTLSSTIDDMFDVTVGYSGLKGDQIPYDEYLVDKVFFKNHYPREIHLHVEALKLKKTPGFTANDFTVTEDARKDTFNLWLREVFMKKDDRLARFFVQGSLVF